MSGMDEMKDRGRRDDLAAVLDMPAGRRLLARLMRLGMRDRLTLSVDEGSGYAVTAFNEGKRAIASAIAESVREIDPRLLARCEIDLGEFERAFEE
jgi:hypothetical protein